MGGAAAVAAIDASEAPGVSASVLATASAAAHIQDGGGLVLKCKCYKEKATSSWFHKGTQVTNSTYNETYSSGWFCFLRVTPAVQWLEDMIKADPFF